MKVPEVLRLPEVLLVLQALLAQPVRPVQGHPLLLEFPELPEVPPVQRVPADLLHSN
jgi:hypothetical protein